jgi:hypothetical protein
MFLKQNKSKFPFGIEFVDLPQIFFTMKNLKILILFLALSTGIQKSYAQPIRFKTSSVSYADKKDNGKWNDWSEFVKSNVLITIDAKKNLISVNSAEVQSFRIKAYGEIVDNENVNIVPFECIDNKFSKCNILVITKKKEGNRMQFYINYNEVKFVYNIYNVK